MDENQDNKNDDLSIIGHILKIFKFDANINENGIVKNQRFIIKLLDKAGQERVRKITLYYFKGCDGILLIYDITERYSFDNVKKWISSIKEESLNENQSKFVIMLIGNKFDLVNKKEKERKVDEEEAIKICDEFNMIWGGEISIKYIEHSAIKALMEKFIIEIYNKKGGKEPEVKTHKKIGKYKKKTKKRCIF